MVPVPTAIIQRCKMWRVAYTHYNFGFSHKILPLLSRFSVAWHQCKCYGWKQSFQSFYQFDKITHTWAVTKWYFRQSIITSWSDLSLFRFRYYIISLSNTWFHYSGNNTLLAQSQYVSILEHLGAPDHCVACRPTCLVLSSEIWMDHKIVSCELGISMSKYPTLLWLMRQRRLQQATVVCIILSRWLEYYSSLSQLLIGNEYYQVIPLHLMKP